MKINLKEHPICSSKTRQRFRKLIKFGMRVSFFYTILTVCSVQLLLAHHEGMSQGIESINVTIELNHESLKALFEKIEEQTNIRFTYYESEVNKYTDINLPKAQRTIKEVLEEVIAKGTTLTYAQVGDNYVIIRRKDETIEPPKEEQASTSQVPSFATITGTVTDAKTQQPLPGVNVIVKNTTKGTTTDAGGKFSIDAEDNDVLVFSFIGFTTFETTVNGRTSIDVAMDEDATALDEVVVNAGYWNVKEKEKTGNISRVTAEEIGNQPVVNPLQAIYGRMPGVYVQQTSGVPGGSFNILIRGRNSLREEGNAPLYVIDGVPFSFDALSSTNTTGGILGTPASPLNAINPSDIESIEVLKDADATAIYGSRGANGVVLITTKKGKSGKTKIEVNVNTGVGQVTKKLNLLNTQQYLEMRNEAFINDGLDPGDSDFDVNGVWDQTRYTDWQDVLIGGTAKSTLAQLSFSGGNANTNLLIGGTYKKETTVFPGESRYLKGSSHIAINHTSPNNKFTVNLTANYTSDDNDQPGSDLASSAVTLSPNAPKLYTSDGKLNWENSSWANPLAELEKTYSNKTTTFLGNVILGYEIIPGLKVKASLGITDQQSKEITKTPSTYYDPASGMTTADAVAIYANGDVKNWIIEPQITWERKIGEGQLTLLAGTTFQSQIRNASSFYAQGFSSDALLGNPRAASTFGWYDYGSSTYKYNAVFGRINYNWNGKYILNITGRRDGSSRFGPGNRFANFGAVGAAWIFSNEEFVKSFTSLSYGKLRMSYGVTGNDQIGDYQYLNSYTSTVGYQGVPGLGPATLYNPSFGWESNKKFEVAVDLGFLNDHIYLSGSYYRNRSSDQLVGYSLPLTTGFSSILSNFPATVENKGLEFELSTVNIKKNEIEWTTSINITLPKNKLVEFPGLETSTYSDQYVIGKPLSIQKVFHAIGVDPVSGIFQFEDYNGDAQITSANDRKSIKEVVQEYYGGFNSSLKFKRWKLDFLLQFVKQDGYNILWQSFMPGGANINQPELVMSRWQNEGDKSDVQRFATFNNTDASNAYARYRSSDAGIGDASFLRLRNLSLSYTLPTGLIPNMNGTIYVQGQNLLTITKYDGLDPEVQSSNRIPPLRFVSVGVQLGF